MAAKRKSLSGDSDSESSSRPKPGRNPLPVLPKHPMESGRPKNPMTVTLQKPRKYPTEKLVEGGYGGIEIDMSPALKPFELADIESIIEGATPEQFQQALALLMRKMMVRGLKDIPPPKSIKELQVLYDMFRKAEGIEARDRGGGAPAAGFLPRMVSRKPMGVIEVTEEPSVGITDEGIPEPSEESEDDLFASSPEDDDNFEI